MKLPGSLRNRRGSPLAATGFIVILVGGCLFGLWNLGALEPLELIAYDWYLRHRPMPAAPDSRIVLITITERDLQDQGGWPLPDGVLAQVIETIARHRPRAIGVDIYRDIPVPPGSTRLETLLASEPRIVWTMKFGEGTFRGVPPPAPLRGTERVGFNDILVDPGGTVRRGLMFLDDGATTATSFAMRLALRYLEPQGIAAQPDPSDPRHLRLGRATIRPLEPQDGPYVSLDARGYQFLLDFRERGAFASLTLKTLLSGGVRPDAITDKIVLVGVVAESVKDDFYTPHSRGFHAGQQMAGVVVHASIVAQLLRIALEGASPIETSKKWQEISWMLLWGAAGGAIGFWVRSPWWFPLAAGGGLLSLGGLGYLTLWWGWWIPTVPPALAWVASGAMATAYVSYQETVQRAALMQLFSRSVSKEVAEAIWKQREQFLDGARPRSQQLTVTALFTDLTGFTTVSEGLGPEHLMEWLNEYMDAMAQEITRHGGVIRQYAGDAIVALFGVPVPRQGDAEISQDAANAIRCALAMETTLLRLNRRWQAEGRPTAGMRIGILTGPVVAGTLGSAERSEYVVVGDTMNTASRLESFDKTVYPPDPLTRPCRILVGEPTLGRLAGEFETEWVGDVTLKGKTQPVGIYRVVGVAEAQSAALGRKGRA